MKTNNVSTKLSIYAAVTYEHSTYIPYTIYTKITYWNICSEIIIQNYHNFQINSLKNKCSSYLILKDCIHKITKKLMFSRMHQVMKRKLYQFNVTFIVLMMLCFVREFLFLGVSLNIYTEYFVILFSIFIDATLENTSKSIIAYN